MDMFLLLLRIVVGGLLFGHGAQKLFGWFGGHGVDGTAGFMESLGYRPGRTAAIGAGLGETVGGGLLALGLFTPLAAAVIAGVMINAIVSAHWSNGVWATEGGYELPLTYAASALTMAAVGPGLFSFDAALGISTWGGAPAVLATGLGIAAAATVLSRRAGREAIAAEEDTQQIERRAA